MSRRLLELQIDCGIPLYNLLEPKFSEMSSFRRLVPQGVQEIDAIAIAIAIAIIIRY
jgi:hypothetical protein